MNDTPGTTEESAGGILLRNKGNGAQALLIRVRAHGFEIPKGHIEAGESPEEAALREVREETALLSEVEAGPQVGVLEYVFFQGEQAVSKRVTYFRMTSSAAMEFGRRPSGTRELAWFDASELRRAALVSEELRAILLGALEDL